MLKLAQDTVEEVTTVLGNSSDTSGNTAGNTTGNVNYTYYTTQAPVTYSTQSFATSAVMSTTSTWGNSSVTFSGVTGSYFISEPVKFGLYIKFKRDKARLVKLLDYENETERDEGLKKIL